ncbi:SDR family NAD(P)-dependent oxidoreductase [Amnibacterium setariae]|uniref:SDR family oxidoreductase n=1 Tax=Amnibacterium setariae TaxID=2306585 RepID=A0A3A1U381_9MICO|nr:SDR family NAD(P)-dependent oxidoreductase [Amnibacterium setariae]RIX30833.1 SDR family oxidoreductase [Amnibacterium setariae]
MSTDLRGRVALVTGASGGIGSDLAVRLAAAGCDVAVHWSGNEAAARGVADRVREHGVRAAVLQADLADPAQAGGLVDAVERELGPVDVLVPTAGVNLPVQAVEDLSFDDWSRTIAVNLTAPFLLAQRAVPGMVERRFGRVLFVSSVAAFTGGMVGPHYAASKSGLHGMLQWLAKRTAKDGVTVNAIAPALVASGMVPDDLDASAIPVDRIGQPEEVGELAMAMLTNAYLTGKVFLADGGMFAH